MVPTIPAAAGYSPDRRFGPKRIRATSEVSIDAPAVSTSELQRISDSFSQSCAGVIDTNSGSQLSPLVFSLSVL